MAMITSPYLFIRLSPFNREGRSDKIGLKKHRPIASAVG